MENLISIKSNSLTLNHGKLLMKKDINGNLNVPGNFVFEGQNPEEVCENELLNSKIIKPLHPKISWTKLEEKTMPMISLNYLTEFKNV